MNTGAIYGMIEDANDDDLINIFVFSNSIQFTKEKFIVNIDKSSETIEISKKYGTVDKTIIDVKAIKYINRIQTRFGADPRDMKI